MRKGRRSIIKENPLWKCWKVVSIKRGGKKFLAIARGKNLPDGTFKVISNTGDRTEDILLAVMGYLRSKIVDSPEKKVYSGISNNDLGKLLYIKPGWTFHVIREYDRE